MRTYRADRLQVSYTDADLEAFVELDGYMLPKMFELRCLTDDDTPEVTLLFKVVDEGRVEVRNVTFDAKDPGREVQGRDLRGLSLSNLLEDAVQLVAVPVLREVKRKTGENAPMKVLVMEAKRVTEQNPRGGVHAVNRRRLRVTPAQLRRVAEVVRDCEGKPSDAVADALGVGTRAAQLWIKRARDLSDPETGKPYLDPSHA